jgi:hypothetical protein
LTSIFGAINVLPAINDCEGKIGKRPLFGGVKLTPICLYGCYALEIENSPRRNTCAVLWIGVVMVPEGQGTLIQDKSVWHQMAMRSLHE